MGVSRWVVIMALGVAGALLIHHHMKTSRSKSAAEGEEWPNEKNFGAFPPEIPDAAFDGLT